MDKFYNGTLQNLETAIYKLDFEADYSIQRIEVVIHMIIECLSEVRKHNLEKRFKNKEEEMRFSNFKNLSL